MKMYEATTETDLFLPSSFVPEGRFPVYFDIETTGFSKHGCPVYLIASITPEEAEHTIRFRQWFSECPDEEPEVLAAFLDSIPQNAMLCHFNGANFDIPFLQVRCELHGIDWKSRYPFLSDTGLDFYRLLHPLYNLFQMPGQGQKEYEHLSDFQRTDPYDGGVLISFYRDYVGPARFDPERAEMLRSAMLCHNREDLYGMYSLLRLLPVLNLITGFSEAVTLSAARDAEALTVRIPLSAELPNPIVSEYRRMICGPKEKTVFEKLPVTLTLNRREAVLTVPFVSGTYKYFFPNYRDYFYLPKEDRVVHKSIGESLAKCARVRAKREQAYQPCTGVFLPGTESGFGRIFRASADDAVALSLVPDEFSEEQLLSYTKKMLSRFGEKA